MAIESLSIDHIARIEGHGNVQIKVEDGVLTQVELNITEPARMFETMVKGRSYAEVSYVASRICGICSSSHCVTSLMAAEKAFGVEVSERTAKLRHLLIHGSYLQNHAAHLYLFAAPDYVDEKSVFPLAQKAPDIFQRALRIKRLGNELCTLVGGRSIHPINAVVGGFTCEPAPEDLIAMADKLDALVEDCAKTTDLFSGFDTPSFESRGDYLALSREGEYAIDAGQVSSLNGGWKRDVTEYDDFIAEKTMGYSNSKLSYLPDGSTYLVGALARINHSWKYLTPTARIVAAKAALRPVCRNSFKNNLSQAIEIVDVAERCAELCRELATNPGDSSVVEFEPRAGRGVAATEAPRGIVYHDLTFDDAGRVVAANIVTPTAQSLGNLENDIRDFAPSIVDLPADEFKKMISKLVRAYDPCLSCAVH